MEENGGKRGGGGDGKIAGIAHWMWVVVEENGTKMGEKGEEWEKIPICHSPIFPIFPEVEDLPHSSLCNNQLNSPRSPTEKWEFCHSPTLATTAAEADA